MPRNSTYRALTPEFRDMLDKKDLWPMGKAFHEYMSMHFQGISGNTLGRLKRGAALSDKAAMGLISMLWDTEGDQHPLPSAKLGSREAIEEFLADRVEDASELTPHDIFDLVTGEPSGAPAPGKTEVDYLRLGVDASPQLVRLPGRKINKRSRICDTSEIADAMSWLFVNVAHSLSDKRTRERMSLEEAHAITERHIGISYKEYVEQARRWHEHLPVTIRLALGKREPTGVSIVLPLTLEAYNDIRAGNRCGYECGPGDLVVPSQHLYIEACGERVGPDCPDPGEPSHALLTSLLIQMAHCTRLHKVRRREAPTIHLLSFPGTELSRLRLAAQGFRRLDTVLPRSGLPIMERVFRRRSLVAKEALTVMVMEWMSRYVSPY